MLDSSPHQSLCVTKAAQRGPCYLRYSAAVHALPISGRRAHHSQWHKPGALLVQRPARSRRGDARQLRHWDLRIRRGLLRVHKPRH
jgi:hypothetical protein